MLPGDPSVGDKSLLRSMTSAQNALWPVFANERDIIAPMQGETPMFQSKCRLATIVMLVGLFASGCDRASTTRSAPPGDTQPSSGGDTGQSGGVTPFKYKEKPVLSPTVAFADPGFRSPVSQNERGKGEGLRNREAFVRSFRSQPECFGVTLLIDNPKNADFGLQTSYDSDGKTARWAFFLFRMDSIRLVGSGNSTGPSISVSPAEMAKSVCSAIREAVSDKGGRVTLSKKWSPENSGRLLVDVISPYRSLTGGQNVQWRSI